MPDTTPSLKNQELSNAALARASDSIFRLFRTSGILMVLIIWSIGVSPILFPSLSIIQNLTISLAQDMIGGFFFAILAFKLSKQYFSFSKVFAVVLIGSFTWLLSHFHLILMALEVPASALAPIIAICTLTSLYLLGFYFYFIPFLFGNIRLVASIAAAPIMVPSPRIQAIRIIATGIIVSLAVQQTCEFFKSPVFNLTTTHHVWLDIVGASNQALYWFITTFLGLGFGSALTNQELTSHKENSRSWTYSLFGGYGVGHFLLLIFFLGVANVYISLTSAPAFKTTLSSSQYNSQEKTLTIQMTLSSSGVPLTSIQPMFFRIAGEGGFPLSEMPSDISPPESLNAISEGASEIPFKLIFRITNRQDDFEKLQDKGLWYLNHKILELP